MRQADFFLNCYLAVQRPTLGHSQGDSLTNLMLITAFFNEFRPESLVTTLQFQTSPCVGSPRLRHTIKLYQTADC